jgi:hypothetical protein
LKRGTRAPAWDRNDHVVWSPGWKGKSKLYFDMKFWICLVRVTSRPSGEGVLHLRASGISDQFG